MRGDDLRGEGLSMCPTCSTCCGDPWHTHAHPTPSEPEATVVEEWGVRWANGNVYDCREREGAESIAALDRSGGVPVRRTRTTYADRVTEWTEADR